MSLEPRWVANAIVVFPVHIPGRLAAKPGYGIHYLGSLEWGDCGDIESSVLTIAPDGNRVI